MEQTKEHRHQNNRWMAQQLRTAEVEERSQYERDEALNILMHRELEREGVCLDSGNRPDEIDVDNLLEQLADKEAGHREAVELIDKLASRIVDLREALLPFVEQGTLCHVAGQDGHGKRTYCYSDDAPEELRASCKRCPAVARALDALGMPPRKHGD